MIQPRTFRKKPVTIEAVQLAGSTAEMHAVYQWVEENTLGSFEPLDVIEARKPSPASGVSIDPRDGRLIISTLEGLHWANQGDWIIRGVQGEFYPCKPDIFDATYTPESETALSLQVIDTDAPEGWETSEVSAAKDEVTDLIGQRDYYEVVDCLNIADEVVNLLLALGWRPTNAKEISK